MDLPGTTPRDTLTSFLPGLQVVVWKLKFSAQTNLPTKKDVARFSSFQIETAF